jgi:diguanylate cyclase (GGDEF)-like protein
VVSHVNITRRRLAEQQLSHSASHDPRSGLANCALGDSALAKALAPRPGRTAQPDVGLMYIDLDGFKAVNDEFGHAAGDEVLMTVAGRLRACVRPDTTVVRLGGDEFLVLSLRIDAAQLAALAYRIERSLAEPHLIRGRAASYAGRPPVRASGIRRDDFRRAMVPTIGRCSCPAAIPDWTPSPSPRRRSWAPVIWRIASADWSNPASPDS